MSEFERAGLIVLAAMLVASLVCAAIGVGVMYYSKAKESGKVAIAFVIALTMTLVFWFLLTLVVYNAGL